MKMLDFARRKLPEHPHPVLSVLNTNTRAIGALPRMGWKLTSGIELEFTPEQYPAVVKKCALVWMRYEGSARSNSGRQLQVHRTAKKARKWILGPEGMVLETHKKRPNIARWSKKC